MHDRRKIVTSMLVTVRQIAESEAFARDAMRYANMAEDLDDAGAASALRGQVVARRVDVIVLRGVMAELADALARIPIEAE